MTASNQAPTGRNSGGYFVESIQATIDRNFIGVIEQLNGIATQLERILLCLRNETPQPGMHYTPNRLMEMQSRDISHLEDTAERQVKTIERLILRVAELERQMKVVLDNIHIK